MIVRDAKLTQPLVNIETLRFGSYILHNGSIGIIFPYRRNDREQLSYSIHILTESKLSDIENGPISLIVPKGTKVLPVKIKTIEYEVIENV